MLQIIAHYYLKKCVGGQLIYFYSTWVSTIYDMTYKGNGKLKPIFEYYGGWKALYGDIDPYIIPV